MSNNSKDNCMLVAVTYSALEYLPSMKYHVIDFFSFFFWVHKIEGIKSHSLNKLSAFLLILQKSAVKLEFGDATTVADQSDAQSVSRSFPLTYGQPLVHFLTSAGRDSDSQGMKDHPAIRY